MCIIIARNSLLGSLSYNLKNLYIQEKGSKMKKPVLFFVVLVLQVFVWSASNAGEAARLMHSGSVCTIAIDNTTCRDRYVIQIGETPALYGTTWARVADNAWRMVYYKVPEASRLDLGDLSEIISEIVSVKTLRDAELPSALQALGPKLSEVEGFILEYDNKSLAIFLKEDTRDEAERVALAMRK